MTWFRVVVGLRRITETALVSELDVVRAGDVRHRRPQACQVPDQGCANPPCAGAAGARERQVRDLAALLQDLDHPRVVRAVVPWPEAVAGLIHAPARLGQQPARDRRRPRGVRLTGWDVARPRRRFRRRQLGPSRRRPLAVVRVEVLLGPVPVELVARRGLPRHAERRLRSTWLVKAGFERSKSTVHFVGSPAFLFQNMPGTVLLGPGLPVGRVEPQLVRDRSAAEHRVDVVHRDELSGRSQAGSFSLWV